MSNIADFENLMSLDNPIKSTATTRWERRANRCLSGLTNRSDSTMDVEHNANDSCMDRFIPNRAGTKFDITQSSEEAMDVDSDYSKILQENTCTKAPARVLAYKHKAPIAKDGYQSSLKVLYSCQGSKKIEAKPTRHIPSAPVKILDAPELLDDYYLNLMSWSSSDLLAVALSQSIYLWDPSSGNIKELMSVDGDDYISSVSFIQQGGSHIAVGTASNTVQLWDVQAGKQVRSMGGHSSRVGALAWNSHILTSGSRDTTIINHDVRIQNHIIGSMKQHTQEVYGLSWSPDGAFLASGANDNSLCIYGASSTLSMDAEATYVLNDHQAAVKALAWSPHERNLLASGGGTADRCIKFWNASSGSLMNSIDTGSQVCALQWSPHEKEILSSHGYAENQLCLWKYPTMARIKELKGHSARVLHMATSPDGGLVCSGAADETLRFWNVFASEGKRKGDSNMSSSSSNGLSRSGTSFCLR